jgi:hypothetical protein
MGTSFQDVSLSVGFKAWTGERQVVSIGTDAGSIPLPFQRWRNFKEAFAPEVIERAFTETKGQVRHIVDPFGGSGTTALAGQFLGAKPTIIEVNPYLADLIEAKLATYDLDQVGHSLATVSKEALKSGTEQRPIFRGAPKTFVEPGLNGRYIFSRAVASRIVAYAAAIRQLSSPEIRRLFRVLLASIAVSVSNVTISGKGRRYRGSWQGRSVPATRVDELFHEHVLNALYDLRLYSARACREYTVLRGDCRNLLTSVGPADLAVFSPPYPNSFDYTDVYNVELWALGYLDSPEANLELRNCTLRSHVQIRRDMTGKKYPSKALSKTLAGLRAVRSKLWNRYIPEMVSAYFSDLGDVMSQLSSRLRLEGRVYMVVGDSRYAGVRVPVADVLAQVAPSLNLRVVAAETCRSMRASPQQGGREELAETLLVLEKTT